MQSPTLTMDKLQYAAFGDYVNSYQPYKPRENEKFTKNMKHDYYESYRQFRRQPDPNHQNPNSRFQCGPHLPNFFQTYRTMYKKFALLFPVYIGVCSQMNCDDWHIEYHRFDSSKSPLLSMVSLCAEYTNHKKYMNCRVFEELMSVVWHPRNIPRFNDWGMDIEIDF